MSNFTLLLHRPNYYFFLFNTAHSFVCVFVGGRWKAYTDESKFDVTLYESKNIASFYILP